MKSTPSDAGVKKVELPVMKPGRNTCTVQSCE